MSVCAHISFWTVRASHPPPNIPAAHRWKRMTYASAECWLDDKWAGISEGYCTKSAECGVSGHILCYTFSLQLSVCYNFVYSWLKDRQQQKPCILYNAWTLPPSDNSSLQVDGTPPNCQTVNPRSLLNHPNSLALIYLSLTLKSWSFICAIIQWAKSLASQDSQLRLWAQQPQWPSYQPSVCVGQLIRRKPV